MGSISIVSLLVGCSMMEPSTPAVLPKSVPDISVAIDCGKCEVRPSVPESIRKGYVAAAGKAGVRIEPNARIDVTIKDYTERSLAMRSATFAVSILLPPVALALKDEIKVDALVEGKHVPLEYHYRIPFFGIESVAQKVGELSFFAAVNQGGHLKSSGQ